MDRRALSDVGVLGVGALACAALLLESTLTRLLAVTQYYHFAFLVVSLALLGFGAGGAVLASSARLSHSLPARSVAGAGAGFAASTATAYAVANLLPFDSYRIGWEPRQLVFFALYYLGLTLPFLCAGIGIGAGLAAGGPRSHLVYAANLFGSAAGVLLAPALMALAGVPGGVLGSALIALIPLAHPQARTGGRRMLPFGDMGAGISRLLLVLGALVIGLFAWLNYAERAPLGMVLSPYKGLSQALRYPGAEVIFRRWDAGARVDVVAGAGTRKYPGLSYAATTLPPEQLGLSVDAESLQPITRATADEFTSAVFLPEALAFRLKPQARVLVLQPGGGLGVLQALAGGAREVVAVADDALVRRAVQRTAGGYDPFAASLVSFVVRPPRAYLRGREAQYDVIFLPLTDSYRPVASGAYSLGESYDLTVEAMEVALSRLAPGGVLVITRWLQAPPSEELRLIATLVKALRLRGVAQPGEALVAYRGIQTLTALVRPDGWGPDALAEVRASTDALRYDLVWAPDIGPEETNRYNVTPTPAHYLAVRALLAAADPRDFYAAYPYSVTPATDDRPFFFHFFRWGQTPQVLATLGRTWQPFGGSGYLVLLLLLALVLALSLMLVVTPLALQRGTPAASVARPLRLRALAYFGLIGLAFLFVEIPLIQRHILLMGQPIYAFSVVVLVLLVFSGIGSALSMRTWMPGRVGPLLAGLLALLTAALGGAFIEAALAWPPGWQLVTTVAALAPLGFFMGLPFPVGLAWLHDAAPSLVPWAWAVNGCASVIASVLAAILALSWGLTLVLGLGAVAYAGAWLVLRVPFRSAGRRAPHPDSLP